MRKNDVRYLHFNYARPSSSTWAVPGNSIGTSRSWSAKKKCRYVGAGRVAPRARKPVVGPVTYNDNNNNTARGVRAANERARARR